MDEKLLNQILENNFRDPELVFGKYKMPGIRTIPELQESLPGYPPTEIIEGILRKQRKMLVSGPSKAAKTCLLMELAIGLATGDSWMGRCCTEGKVLYVNLELPDDVFLRRIYDILDAKEMPDEFISENLFVWNLRGYNYFPLSGLASMISLFCIREKVDAVIIDPIYKVLWGDENSAADIAEVCNELDMIARQAECAVIFSHHHSKGAKGDRLVLDRSSGSGVFARDPDAIVDLIQLAPSAEAQEKAGGGSITAWRMEAVLREFPAMEPVNCWFRYPLHIVDTERLLDDTSAVGSARSNLQKSSKRISRADREASFVQAFDELSYEGRPVKVADMAKRMKVTQPTVRSRCEELKDRFWMEGGMIGRISKT